MSKYGIIALEEAENEVVADVVDTTSVEDVADLPEADIAEMTEVAGDIEGNDASMDSAVDTIDTLEVVADKMEESIPEGGMDEPAAAALEAFVNLVMKQAGAKKKAGFALESHKSKATRVKATQESLDSVKAFMKRMWDAVVAGFERAVAWIMKWVDIVFNATFKLERRAEAMAKAADAKKGKKPTKSIESAGDWANDITSDGKVEPAGFAKNYSAFCSEQKTIVAASISAETLTKGGNELLAVLSEAGNGDKFQSAAVKLASDSKASMPVSTNRQITVPEGMALHEAKFSLGDFSIYALTIKDATFETIKQNYSSEKMWIDKSAGYSKPEKSMKGVVPLTPEQAYSVAEEVKAQMGLYKAFRAECSKIKAIQDKVKAKAKELSTANKDNEKIVDDSKVAVKLSKVYLSQGTSVLAAIRGLDIKVATAALAYCGASLKLAGAKEEAPKAA